MSEAGKSLQQIIEEMERLTSLENRGDAEANHIEADDLLVQALLLIGRNSELQKQAVERLRKAYAAVEKWYA